MHSYFYNVKKNGLIVVALLLEADIASSTGKTPRRFYRLTHDRNKSWYYTCIREQY